MRLTRPPPKTLFSSSASCFVLIYFAGASGGAGSVEAEVEAEVGSPPEFSTIFLEVLPVNLMPLPLTSSASVDSLAGPMEVDCT